MAQQGRSRDAASRLADWVVYHSEICDAETAECVWSTCRSMFSRIPEGEIEVVLEGLASGSELADAMKMLGRPKFTVIDGGAS